MQSSEQSNEHETPRPNLVRSMLDISASGATCGGRILIRVVQL